MAITGLTLLQKLQKLFGVKNVSNMMGRTSNVQTLGQGINNPFAATFSKKYLKENPDGIDEAATVVLENMQFAFGNKNPRQMKNFESNVNTLYELKFAPAGPEAQVVDLGSKQPVTGKGLESLKTDMGLPKGVNPNSPMGKMLSSTNRMNKIGRDIGAKIYSSGDEANRASVVREIILEDGRLDLPKEVVDGLMGRTERSLDPIEVFNAIYKRNDKKLEKLDNFVFKGEEARKDSKQVAKDFLDDEAGFDLNENAPYRYKKPEDDLATKLKDYDGDPDAMASGGLAGQLHMNQGGRVGFANGGIDYDIDSLRDPFAPLKSEPIKYIGRYGDSKRDPYTGEYYKYFQDHFFNPSPKSNLDLTSQFNQYAPLLFRGASGYPDTNYSEVPLSLDQLNEFKTELDQIQSSRKKSGVSEISSKFFDKINEAIKNSTPNLPVTQTAPVTTQPTSTGIQTIPDNKFSVNVMMNEQGNVADDQGMAELARETGMAPSITNLPINNMSDVMRMIGPGDGISEVTGYNMPPPSVEQRMQEAADKGLDARMGRTYAENIQAMADPRMASQMPPMPIDIMPPMPSQMNESGNVFTQGGYADEDEAIADLGLERYNQLFNSGGRVGFKNGGMDRRTFLKLMGGLASLPVVGKLFKGAKVASKVVPLKNTTTTMPAWFPDLVDKFVAKGVGKKIDADMMEYTSKDLPGITMTKHDDGRIFVEGQNDYGRNYNIEYEPPGVELLDETTGKSVKTKGDFTAQEEVPVNMDPDGNTDFDGEILESVDDILTGDSRSMEGFATGRKISFKEKKYAGESKSGEAEIAAENRADAFKEQEAMEADEFASGGLAKLLGE